MNMTESEKKQIKAMIDRDLTTVAKDGRAGYRDSDTLPA